MEKNNFEKVLDKLDNLEKVLDKLDQMERHLGGWENKLNIIIFLSILLCIMVTIFEFL